MRSRSFGITSATWPWLRRPERQGVDRADYPNVQRWFDAIAATIASLPFGIFVSYALARWRFPGKIILNAAVHLPLVMPPVVTGFLLLILFGRKGIFGAFLAEIGIVLSFRWTGAAVACAVMGFPLMVRAMQLSFESIDERLEQAAETLGANRMWTFFLVSLPLALLSDIPLGRPVAVKS
jgi:molybdate transport system permease protein